ncbi:hypothetical protein IFR05_009136 [Cadophora sp. M221]|nr:hypothetical protein IFR05_009136 [Cadophora sp. M221]
MSEYKLKVSLETESRKIDGVPHCSLRFEYETRKSFLEISFHRTIRVPDDETSYVLPPDHGPFPIYSVRKFQDTLPASMVATGGCLLLMYQREAMWMYFKASQPFAVKVYAGGINAVLGEPRKQDMGTVLRQTTRLSQEKSIQDYVVAGPQSWLDGVATHDGSFDVVPLKNYHNLRLKIKVMDHGGGHTYYYALKPCVIHETH